MKRLTVMLCLLAALRSIPATATCDPTLTYQIVKSGILEQKPSTVAEFDRMMSGLGLTHDGAVWKCETAEGTFLASFIGGKQWIHLEYTPNKPEKVPDSLLSILADRAHVKPVGPHWIEFEYHSDESAIASFKSPYEFNETITINLVGGIYEGTQCTIMWKAKATR
jgi:hypothetical protein